MHTSAARSGQYGGEHDKVQRRLLYFPAPGRKFVMLHGFVKKTQKTPPKEIEIAEQRMRDYTNRLEKPKQKEGERHA